MILRHYSFECKTIVQERPYVSRPSRTQQLFNPNLVPKLSSDVPQSLLRKKGIADEQLAKIEQGRLRKYEREDNFVENVGSPKRPKSVSSSSSMPVETNSTTGSESETSSSRASCRHSYTSPRAKPERKRRRSSQSGGSFLSPDEGRRQGEGQRASSRHTRRRIGDISPPERGRRRSRTHSRERRSILSSGDEYRERTRHKSNPISTTADHGGHSHRSINSRCPNIEGMRRGSSISNETRHQYHEDGRSPSRNSFQIITHPAYQREDETRFSDTRSAREAQNRNARRTNHGSQRGIHLHSPQNQTTRDAELRVMNMPQGISSRTALKERSLSPFSKRLALTRQ